MADPQEVELAFVFADLSGFTAFTEAHGNMDAARMADRYATLTRSILLPATQLVKTIGDEVMIAAEDATSAVKTAIALDDAIHSQHLFPMVRIGMHYGNAVEHNGDYFGTAVNVAARVAAHASAGQILCTNAITSRADELENIMFMAKGLVHFRNVAESLPIFEIARGETDQPVNRIDPVCRMCVSEELAPAKLPFGSETYYFCSFDCARTFAEHPERYIAR